MGRKMVRLQQFELNMRPIGFQDTPDSAHTVPRPAEPKLKGKGVKNLNCKNSGRAGRNFTRLSWRASTVTRSRWSSSWMLLCTARFSSRTETILSGDGISANKIRIHASARGCPSTQEADTSHSHTVSRRFLSLPRYRSADENRSLGVLSLPRYRSADDAGEVLPARARRRDEFRLDVGRIEGGLTPGPWMVTASPYAS